MKDAPARQASGIRLAIDIGSTVVKVARLGDGDVVLGQDFHPRDFDGGIANQVQALLHAQGVDDLGTVAVCSSANGGLRVGIACLSPHFSGAAMRNQVLEAGANPIYVCDLSDEAGNSAPVDILLVGGGIDCEDAGPLASRLNAFHAERYRYGSLVYAGNTYLAGAFTQRYPDATVVANPLADSLWSRSNRVFEAVRRAYLDDLVYKDGVSEIGKKLKRGIRPTPEIVNQGFQRALVNHSNFQIAGSCILMDIGGATTDFHYTVEIVQDESEERPSPGQSVARYVFTDLGIVASRDSTVLQLRSHPRLYEFLAQIHDGDVREAYRALREGDHEASPQLLSYACVFLGLDRFAHGRGPGLPAANLGKVSQIVLTGGAAQSLDENRVGRIFDLFAVEGLGRPVIVIDRLYQIWIDGITWLQHAPAGAPSRSSRQREFQPSDHTNSQ